MRIYYSCCLCKYLPSTLYGLKQASRAWHRTLKTEIESMGFKESTADPGLFIKPSSPPAYLLIYVDDILVITNNTYMLNSVKNQISTAFETRDLGLLSCDNATCPVYTSAALIPSFPPFPPQTPHNCVSPPHSQLIDTCATPFRAPDPAIMLTDTMMPLCRIVPASYQEYPKYMPGICSSTPDLFNAASSANLPLLLPL